MGNLILCAGKRTEQPFVFSGSRIEIYTIEEMCYYIYNYIDTLTEESFDIALAEWLKEQELFEVSKKMRHLIVNHNSLKDKAVTLLCACDYYKEEEIRDLLLLMNQLENMSFFERCMRKCGKLFEENKYKEAEAFLSELLGAEYGGQFTVEEYGDFMHNLAVIHIHTASYAEAAKEFLAAYGRNHKEETLKQYLTALLLSGQKKHYQTEAVRLEAEKELLCKIEQELEQNRTEAGQLPEYAQLQRLFEMKNQGQMSQVYEGVRVMIEKWKQEYIEETVG